MQWKSLLLSKSQKFWFLAMNFYFPIDSKETEKQKGVKRLKTGENKKA